MDDMTKMLYERRDLWRIQPGMLLDGLRVDAEDGHASWYRRETQEDPDDFGPADIRRYTNDLPTLDLTDPATAALLAAGGER